MIDPGIVEAHAIDKSLMFGEAEEARGFISILRLGGERADLDMTEAHRPERIDGVRLFIESCSKADWVGKSEPRERHWLRFRWRGERSK